MINKTRSTAVILSCFQSVPTGIRKAIFIALFRLFYYLSAKQRLIAIHNLTRAFPEKSLSEIMRIVRGVYRNLAIVAAEFFDIPSLTEDSLKQRVEVEGMEHCLNALKKERGVLMFGGHLGNWELGAAAVSLLVKPLMVIYRPLDNPMLENLVTWVRSSTGNVPMPKDLAMRPMLRFLKNNGILGLLIDQNVAWQEGVFVDYFGRLASTTNGMALLALHTGAPAIPCALVRLESGNYKLLIGEEVELVRTDDRDADIIANTQNFTRVVEEMVGRYPDQWLWVHQRWKTKTCQVPDTSHRRTMLIPNERS
jgi:KDO2-lipid IV(A) lauroyltransferase